MQVRNLKTVLAIICSISSGIASGQTLECQLMRDEILSESNQQRQLRQQQQTQQFATPGSLSNPSLAPFYEQARQQGQMIGQGAGALLGAPILQDKIRIYKQKCE
jgi:hypothetical protein